MTTIKVSEAREKLAEVLERTQVEPVILERHGQAAAVLISPAMYERLVEALEEMEDVAAFDAALADKGANIPWEQVKADLGWK